MSTSRSAEAPAVPAGAGRRSILALLPLILLGACGKKGPLRLPPPEPAALRPAPATPPPEPEEAE